MGVPLVIAFEVEAIKPNSKYEKRQALKRLEKLKRPRSMNLKVA
jgi:hypothetical protein